MNNSRFSKMPNRQWMKDIRKAVFNTATLFSTAGNAGAERDMACLQTDKGGLIFPRGNIANLLHDIVCYPFGTFPLSVNKCLTSSFYTIRGCQLTNN